MAVINYISFIAIPLIIFIIICEAVKEKKLVFDIFLNGAIEGAKISLKIFPTLIGLFFAVGMIRSSGILDLITKLITPVLNLIKFPSEVVPLVLIRPISGSASIAVATDIIKNYGADSFSGLLASIIIGSTETTLYTIVVYTSSVKIKNTRKILIPALMTNIMGIIMSFVICKLMY